MQILENACPSCHGHLVLDAENRTLTCEDCGMISSTKDKKLVLEVLEKAVEYGPKSKRLKLSPIGELLLHPDEALPIYLRETLEEAVKGLEMEAYDLDLLKKWNLLKEPENV